MEANFFRCLAAELGDALAGRRVDKIYNPAPGVWTFKVRTPGGASYLLSRSLKGAGLLFLTSHKPANPAEPSARCMWLRKRLCGRKLLEARVHWPTRRLAFGLSPGEGTYLLLAPEGDPQLADELPAQMSVEPSWPTLSQVLAQADIWREFPQVSPPLRRLLAVLPAGRAEAAYDAIRRGGCGAFFVYGRESGASQSLVWRLPEALRGDAREKRFETALEAADSTGRQELFPHLEKLENAQLTRRLRAERKRVKRQIMLVEKDRSRLTDMAALAVDGEALRGVLYTVPAGEKRSCVEVPLADGGTRRLELDATLSVTANMERLFRLAAKGRRGLTFVAGREQELRARLAAVEKGTLPADARPLQGTQAKPRKARIAKPLPAAVAQFRTSDGFTALRGKSAKGNHALLSGPARPYDLWFHAAGGPGAHVVLKREYPDQDIPETSILEAAGLAALKSHAAGGRVEVMYALVKHVHKRKGFAQGQVAVDQVIAVVNVEPDPDLDDRLGVQ